MCEALGGQLAQDHHTQDACDNGQRSEHTLARLTQQQQSGERWQGTAQRRPFRLYV
jgi:hypothetical protein